MGPRYKCSTDDSDTGIVSSAAEWSQKKTYVMLHMQFSNIFSSKKQQLHTSENGTVHQAQSSHSILPGSGCPQHLFWEERDMQFSHALVHFHLSLISVIKQAQSFLLPLPSSCLQFFFNTNSSIYYNSQLFFKQEFNISFQLGQYFY